MEKCEYCGKKFKVRPGYKNYCSARCRGNHLIQLRAKNSVDENLETRRAGSDGPEDEEE